VRCACLLRASCVVLRGGSYLCIILVRDGQDVAEDRNVLGNAMEVWQ
jgi:hypothetical protein